ncbi:MAG: hypothetical protein KGL39_35655 [Patescibacteria group bacterium]|nr:hypothetical protein [Patescibacteria group bacterium]
MAIEITIGPMQKTRAVDFDGTLAKYDGFLGPLVLGEPVPAMVKQVKAWLAAGDEVVIFTARVNCDDNPDLKLQVTMLLQQWCEKNLGRALAITDRKHRRFAEIYDDRAVRVETNTGKFTEPKADDPKA